MVVKLYFEDGTNSVRSFKDSELYELKLWTDDQLVEYFEQKYDVGTIVDWSFVKSSNYSNTYRFDLRDFFNYYDNFEGVLIDGKVVSRCEFLNEDSYEYNLAALEKDEPGNLYLRWVSFDVEDDSHDHDYWHDWPDDADRYSDGDY